MTGEFSISKVLKLWLPSMVCLIVFFLSLFLDLSSSKESWFWLQRSGAIITLLGAWIGFHESKESIQVDGAVLNINTNLPYKIWGISLIIIGTILWGYGDIPFKL